LLVVSSFASHGCSGLNIRFPLLLSFFYLLGTLGP
jgi:hypothetical protein